MIIFDSISTEDNPMPFQVHHLGNTNRSTLVRGFLGLLDGHTQRMDQYHQTPIVGGLIMF